MKRDTWEYIEEFIDKFGHFPKDMDELIVCVDYVINHSNMDEERYYCDLTNFELTKIIGKF